jgi:hypothetical protein
MANQPLTPQPSSPNTVEAFIADRQVFWSRFTRFIVGAVVVLAALLIGMAIFLT